jgi:hypothetical protein
MLRERQDALLWGGAASRKQLFFYLQSERSQFRARGHVIRVKNASDPQAFRDLNKHRLVIDIDHSLCRTIFFVPLSSSFLCIFFSCQHVSREAYLNQGPACVLKT